MQVNGLHIVMQLETCNPKRPKITFEMPSKKSNRLSFAFTGAKRLNSLPDDERDAITKNMISFYSITIIFMA